MLQMHQEEFKLNKAIKANPLLKSTSGDSITTVGDNFCKEYNLLCIDEF
jgi:predicted ATPase